MSATTDTQAVTVPDIGDFGEVPVIEILVNPGDTVAVEDPLVTLESDKATMDVPSPSAGTVGEIRVSLGDKVSQGVVLLTLEAAESTSAADAPQPPPVSEEAPAAIRADAEQVTVASPEDPAPAAPADLSEHHVVVIGSGPGGHTAA